jgi:hypothetical protein
MKAKNNHSAQTQFTQNSTKLSAIQTHGTFRYKNSKSRNFAPHSTNVARNCNSSRKKMQPLFDHYLKKIVAVHGKLYFTIVFRMDP